jgi:hypothetical protein
MGLDIENQAEHHQIYRVPQALAAVEMERKYLPVGLELQVVAQRIPVLARRLSLLEPGIYSWINWLISRPKDSAKIVIVPWQPSAKSSRRRYIVHFSIM